MFSSKKVMLSGIQPTGIFTLGNYLGAIRNWEQQQDDYQCLYFIANLHALTVKQNPEQLQTKTLESIALLLACGIRPERSIIFIQSQITYHTELAWILACSTQFGELSRMTQFKDKSLQNPKNINVGLFTYPVLMAADILLYQPDYIPVGADQKQHLEITRNIAMRFNQKYGETFKIPEPFIPKAGARIMSLTDPAKKMSKSDTNSNGFITILDPPETIVKKFKRAVTDSDREICYREGKDGINNLLTIYSILSNQTIEDVERKFAGCGYGDFKKETGELVAAHLEPIQKRFEEYKSDKGYLCEVVQKGKEAAEEIALETRNKAFKRVGL